MYGYNCTGKCGHCKDVFPQCDRINGTCLQGCETGYATPPRCLQTCNNSFYGENCAQRCGNCLDGRRCDFKNGSCPRGCSSGYRGVYCNQTCTKGRFGQNCSSPCGHCLGAAVCDHVSGNCPIGGCERGFNGSRCETTCDDTSYDQNCNSSCGHCRDEAVCDKVSGNCPAGDCNRGFSGPRCNHTCPAGRYGHECQNNCSGYCLNKEPCRFTTGVCLNGCSPGYDFKQDDKCKTEQNQNPDCESDVTSKIIAAVSSTIAMGLIIANVIGVSIYCRRQSKKREIKSNMSTMDSNPYTTPVPASSTGDYATLDINEQCEKHHFGINCNITCHCDECNHVDGSCGVYPCFSGWVGDTCSEPIQTNHTSKGGGLRVSMSISQMTNAVIIQGDKNALGLNQQINPPRLARYINITSIAGTSNMNATTGRMVTYALVNAVIVKVALHSAAVLAGLVDRDVKLEINCGACSNTLPVKVNLGGNVPPVCGLN
ncbi:multiple epidermal growth factor-like domains protein 10 [Mya arenaria]|uniref:multiple epidermal growth factor-like domains protein 10 n=1 Tax=Mya arenaria TaxID=6604 RepID=UPI0022E94DFC|nr:multiple epidermal growth factor-like domains protein 10 [Mya arenaria]